MRVAIVGYGKLGAAAEKALLKRSDIMTLTAIFTRRPETVRNQTNTPVFNLSDMADFKGKIDVALLCVGSAGDYPKIAPEVLKNFCMADVYDDHENLADMVMKLNAIGKENNTLAIIGAGWDPGLFSMQRIEFDSIFPQAQILTTWGPGISQGHSNAVREIAGVQDCVSLTLPNEIEIERFRKGLETDTSPQNLHTREVYVVAAEKADKQQIQNLIKTHKYFADYKTTVLFMEQRVFNERFKNGLFHAGKVIAVNKNERGHVTSVLELKITMESNPEMSAHILIAAALACYKRFIKKRVSGALCFHELSAGDLSYLRLSEQFKKM